MRGKLKKDFAWRCLNKAREYLFISFDYPADIYLFKQNNRKSRTICEICWKLTIVVNKDANVILLVSLVSTYKFHTSFWCFYCWIWLWTSACRQGTNFFCLLRFFHKARYFCFLANVEISFKYKWISCSYFSTNSLLFLFFWQSASVILQGSVRDKKTYLTLSWRGPLSCRNQSTDLQSRSMDWFLYDNGLRHERVKDFFISFEP